METTDQVAVQASEATDSNAATESGAALSLSPPHIFSTKPPGQPDPQESEPDGSQRRLPGHIEHLPVQLDVRLPVPHFTMRRLLSVECGSVLETAWLASEDLPLSCGREQFLWIEFEAVDEKLTARITRLA
ncbi:MAG: FliM/FliN family flagellar motor switch protein [Acidobacteriaceae bacterium]